METKLLSYANDKEKAIEIASKLLKEGKLVAIPTETVYGLGADARNEQAVKQIFQAKGRPSDNPLIVHLASKSQLMDYVLPYPAYVDQLIDTFSPGPITFVLKCKKILARAVTAGLDTVGIRFPSHPVAHALLSKVNMPVAAPSANLSGKPSPTRASHVMEDLSGKIAAVLDGGPSDVGLESTVIDCTGENPVILRQGKITAADIGQIIAVNKSPQDITEQPKSPGVKYKHYEPEVPLYLVENESKLITLAQREQAKGNRVGALVNMEVAKSIKQQVNKVYILGDSEAVYAHELYGKLRAMKKEDVDLVIAMNVTNQTIGRAVMDRLKRAATKIDA